MLMMLISVAGMLGFGSIAVWLMLRQRAERDAGMRGSSSPVTDAPQSAETQAKPRSSSAPVTADAPRPAPTLDVYEPTEFVALPNVREDDSPRVDEATAFVAPAFGAELDTSAQLGTFADDEPPPDKTEFIPAPLAGWQSADSVEERTALVRPALQSATTVPPREQTAFIAPPPSFLAPTPDLQEPASERSREPTGFVRPPPPRPAAPPTVSIDLGEHLRLAADAFERIHTGATEPGNRDALAGHLAVLASASANALLQDVQPRLTGAPDLRWSAALLALLHNESWPAKTALAPMLVAFDEPRRQAALQLLRSWDDPRGRSIAASALASAQSSEQRVMWLSCFAIRGWDPGADVIEAALADSEPTVLIAGLRLLPRSDQASRLQARLSTHLYATHPRVRMQAIEGALTFGNQSTWLVCRQLARNPSYPEAAEFVGLLGTEAEVAALVESLETQATAQLLHGLALSGRPVALRACLARFDDPDDELRETARDGLTLAAGRPFVDVAAARNWVDGLAGATRWLGGSPRTGAQIVAALLRSDLSSRPALARELSIRSRSRIHVDVTLLTDALSRELAGLGQDIDAIEFERGFPWARDP